MTRAFLLCCLVALGGCDPKAAPTGAASPRPASPASSAVGTAVPAADPQGMPIGTIGIEPRPGQADAFIVDQDAILQVVALAHAGELPIRATAKGDAYRITGAKEGSVTALAGLQPLDEVTHLNGVPVLDPALLRKAYAVFRDAKAISLNLRRGGKLVILEYALKPSRTTGPLDPGGDPPPVASADDKSSAAQEAVVKKLAAAVTKVDETHYLVKRAALDTVLSHQAVLMRSARIIPVRRGDEVVALKLFRIRPGTVLHTLGFKNGDILKAINGHPLASPDQALKAYAEMRKAKVFEVALERRGKSLVIEYRIVD